MPGPDAGLELEASNVEAAEEADAHAEKPADAGASSEVDDSPGLDSDPRFLVRWERPALCPDDPGRNIERSRAAVLATFVPTWEQGWLIYRDPSLEQQKALHAAMALAQARQTVRGYLGPRADALRAPEVFLYRDVDQLLNHSCVNRAARGYYDGAIHVAADWDLTESMQHEYVHHALNGLGARKPMWLHEGLAMLVAGERWWSHPSLGLREWISRSHIPFAAMVEAFPHASDELFAGAAYFQSYVMVRFAHERAPGGSFELLVERLGTGALHPRDAFSEITGLQGEALEEAFRAFAVQPL